MAKEPKVVDLDVRPLLKAKQEPFKVIMEAVDGLTESGDTLILHATFKPDPLLNVMERKNFSNSCEQKEDDHWIVTFVKK
ncbi:MAG TPA: DUF2249 domain-containing protein [Bacilli bacterium]